MEAMEKTEELSQRQKILAEIAELIIQEGEEGTLDETLKDALSEAESAKKIDPPLTVAEQELVDRFGYSPEMARRIASIT